MNKVLHNNPKYVCVSLFLVLTANVTYGQKNRALPNVSDLHLNSSRVVHGEEHLNILYGFLNIYKKRHAGDFPQYLSDVLSDVASNNEEYGYKNWKDGFESLVNADASLSTSFNIPGSNVSPYLLWSRRRDGSVVGSPKRKWSKDLVASTDIYDIHYSVSIENKQFISEYGYWLLLWDDGSQEKVPYDCILRYPKGGGFVYNFPSQEGVPYLALSYYEYCNSVVGEVPISKPAGNANSFVEDNGGPESLVRLSRQERVPDVYGIAREELWQQFSPSQKEFTLSDVQIGAKKLGLETQVHQLSLSQLHNMASPALLFLKDDGRIVTLTAIDDDRAVVIDRGLTRNVERSVLEGRYSGEALIPTKALTQNAAIVADDVVRSLQLKSLDEEVPQQFILRNTGKVPLTLQLEYPLLGVTESKLSKDTLAPGETATLDLKVKWRSILKAPYQNVLVSLQTSDPIAPRLQLAILLNPPQTPAK